MTKRLFFLLILTGIYSIATAQRPQGRGGARGGGAPKLIKGTIVDFNSQQPLEFATFTLFSKRDSSVVGGNITDDKGKFSLQTRGGRFYAKVEFIGYQPLVIDTIRLGPKKPVLDLGVIQLEPDAEVLEQVEVVGEKSQFQMSLDKRVFNPGKDLTSGGANAAEVLDNVPSVTVDVEGNVELRGSGNVRILVNGKPSGLIGLGDSDGLRNIAGSAIERIEVITNPSARYDAEGMAGIINIVLKKDVKQGLNGSFDFTVGYPELYGTAINLNYRKEKFNFFTTYGIRYRTGPGGGKTYQENRTDLGTEITDLVRDIDRQGLSNTIRFGADYYFNEKSILTTAFNYRISDEENRNSIVYSDFLNDLNNPTGIDDRSEIEQEDEKSLEYELTYTKDFDRKGHNLKLNFSYQDNNETEGSDFIERILNPDKTPTGEPDIIQRSNNAEGEKRGILSADYVQPIGAEGKFELGLRGSLREIKNDFLVEQENDNTWEVVNGLSNNFIYDEGVYAAYAIYGNKINKFSYQVGLRSEYSDVKTELVTTDSINDRSYNNLFPSGHIGYEITENDALQISYSRRIRRPRFWDLNPFFTFSDSRNFFSGNPNLNPEFTDAYEIGYMKFFKKGSFGTSLYYRHTKDVITRLLFVDADGNTIRRPENLATQDNYGLEFNGSYQPSRKIRINANANFFRSVTDGEANGIDLYAETFAVTGRASSKITLPKNIDLQLTYNFRGPRKTTQGSRKAIHSLNIGMGKDIFKGKGTLTFSVRDVFNSRKRRSITESETFFQESEFQWRQRQISMTLNYRLNQKKKRGRGGNRGGRDGGDGEF